jgi:hypothetical protein
MLDLARDTSFFERRRGQIRYRQLRFPAESMSMVEPTAEIAVKFGAIRREYQHAIFVSHTHDDGEFISNDVFPALQHHKYFFANFATPASDQYERFVGHALLACDSALVILSKHVLDSTWVPKEIDLILARPKIPAVFLVLDEVSPEHIHPDLRGQPRLLGWRRGHEIVSLSKSPIALRDALHVLLANSAGAHHDRYPY